jgi:hypothetical protein
MKGAKLFVYKGQFSEFAMKKDESVAEMFNRLNDIVNELKTLDFDVLDQDFSHKFLRSLPEKYETIVTLLVREDLRKMTPTEVLGEVQTHDIFKKSQREALDLTNDDGKKSIALKAKSTKEDKNDEKEGNDESDEEMALFVKRFRRMINNKNYDKNG